MGGGSRSIPCPPGDTGAEPGGGERWNREGSACPGREELRADGRVKIGQSCCKGEE